jgi:hypothetical protein
MGRRRICGAQLFKFLKRFSGLTAPQFLPTDPVDAVKQVHYVNTLCQLNDWQRHKMKKDN